MTTAGRSATLVLAAVLAVLTLAAGTAGALPAQAPGGQSGKVRLQVLAIGDFHGALEGGTAGGRPVGGAAVLASYLDQRTREAATAHERTLRLSAGDLIGASPPVSALLDDRPTIAVADEMGFRFSCVGNHEFDDGLAALRRLVAGQTGAADHRLSYLAANVVSTRTGKDTFAPYAVVDQSGVKVGVIGAVLTSAPGIIQPQSIAGLTFLDAASRVNLSVRRLQRRGVHAFIVLLHDGGAGTRTGGPVQGEIVDVVTAMDPDVDVVIGGHTHETLWGTVAGKLVAQAGAFGRVFADIDLTLDRRSGDVTATSVELVDTYGDVAPGLTPDPAVAALVAAAETEVAPIIDRVVGTASGDVTRTQTGAGESAMGDLVADAQRWRMGTQLALTNPGGIRADLVFPGGTGGPVTWGDLSAVQPFINYLVTMKVSGRQLHDVLEQQWAGQPAARMLQVSGMSYSWDASGTVGDRVDPGHVTVDGAPLALEATYTLTTNTFLSAGGDGFSVLGGATDKVMGPRDVEALVDYVGRLPQPFSYVTDGRISATP